MLSALAFTSCKKHTPAPVPDLNIQHSDDLLESLIFGIETVREDNEKGSFIVLSIFKTDGEFDFESFKDELSNLKEEHDYSGEGGLAFAKWCKKQLLNGKCLKIGYDNGLYWADFIDCE